MGTPIIREQARRKQFTVEVTKEERRALLGAVFPEVSEMLKMGF